MTSTDIGDNASVLGISLATECLLMPVSIISRVAHRLTLKAVPISRKRHRRGDSRDE